MTDNIITARLFIDMDGTLATWKQAACFEDLLQENYFRDLPPYQTVVDAVRILCNTRPELDIYVLSAFMPENPCCGRGEIRMAGCVCAGNRCCT